MKRRNSGQMNLLSCLLPPQEVKALTRQAQRRAWGRAYYRDKRKPLQAAYERRVLERDRARRNASRVRRYYRNLETERAAARKRMNALNAKRRESCI